MSKKRNRPQVIAHRGSSHKAPENTLDAFALAIEDGAEGLEMDVRLAGDGTPVLFHDSSLRRFTGKDTRIDSLSAEEIKKVSVGKWFNNRYPKRAQQKYEKSSVPTLEEALEFLKGFEGDIFVELKCRPLDAERTAVGVARLLSGSPLLPRFIVKSFCLDALPPLRRECSDLRTAALFAPKVMSIIRKEKRLVNIASDLAADSLSLHASLATKKLMKRSLREGLDVAIWTVDNPRWLKRALELGVGSVITNKPDLMLLRRRELLHRNSITA
ncbi:MAG: glycerophosphodiester phosphodiesterase [Aridibacter famidurans]|nr:glycerophosphodiester phosphodiesterase [Aridibacter famidurans]